MDKYAIGIDLGGTNIKAALVHSEKGIIEKASTPTNADQGLEHVLTQLATIAKRVSKDFEPEKILGIGIGAPGVISLDRTTVSHPPNLPGWEEVHVAKELEERTGWHTRVENDANLAALGSSRFGAGKNFDHFIMVTLGTGVGGGIIYNRDLFRGATGGAAELGHVSIDYNGAKSNSPAIGGIEAYLGQRFLSTHAWDVISDNRDNELYSMFSDNPEKLDPLALFEAAEKGNRLAIDILAEAGEKLGVAITNYIHILDIRKIIVSGGVAKAGKYILETAHCTALERLLPPMRTDFEIIYEDLGNDAALLGAASLGMETALDS